MICPKCRTNNPDDGIYCKNCGCRLPEYQKEEQPEDHSLESKDEDDGSLLTKILMVCSIVIFLMVLSVFIFVFNKNHQKAKVPDSVPKETTEVAQVTTDQTSVEDPANTDQGSAATSVADAGAASGETPAPAPSDETPAPASLDETPAPAPSDESPVPETDEASASPSNRIMFQDWDDQTSAEDETPIAKANKYIDLASKPPIEYKGHAYALFDFKKVGVSKNFQECVAFCERLGGHMATINNKHENKRLYKYSKGKDGDSNAFFGYTDEGHEGDWRWVDGTPDGYENWWQKGEGDENQPNNRDNKEHYAQFYGKKKDGSWCDAEFGSGSYKFICEWE